MQGEGGARLNATGSQGQSSSPDDPGADRAVERPPTRRPRGPFLLLSALAVAVYVADQASKAWAVTALTDEPPRELIGSLLSLDLIRNAGAAFSLGTGNTWVLTVLAVVVLVVLLRSARRLGSLGWACAFGLVLGGALGNLTDRLLRDPGFGRGHVVDFIDYNGWFVGNVADIGIVSGAALIAVLSLRGIGIDGQRDTSP